MYPPFSINRKASTSDERATRIATEHRVRNLDHRESSGPSTLHACPRILYKPQVDDQPASEPHGKQQSAISHPSRTTDKDDSLLTQGGGEGQNRARNLGKVSKRDRRASSTASFKSSGEVRVGCGRPEAASLSKRTTTRVGDFFAEVLVVGLVVSCNVGDGDGDGDRREDPDRGGVVAAAVAEAVAVGGVVGDGIDGKGEMWWFRSRRTSSKCGVKCCPDEGIPWDQVVSGPKWTYFMLLDALRGGNKIHTYVYKPKNLAFAGVLKSINWDTGGHNRHNGTVAGLGKGSDEKDHRNGMQEL
ncbi:hypothetical protein B0H17DRAFT_1135862 [Mycena rosella]|uniref:Uncharacterized protein n=1 Tax=Mycena rosella TaxID=1033263 RepID=A0AAD7GCF2_MYCRO|nr:hypothetical protein B0H17DRAFT_1135862 [Mycena rosella]